MVDEEAAFDALMGLLGSRVFAEVAVYTTFAYWQDVATLGGVFSDWSGEGPVDECDVFIDGNYTMHLPWPALSAWAWLPAADDVPSMLELIFGNWRVRFTPADKDV